jgi:hypothetical protein
VAELLYSCAYATWQELVDKCACANSVKWQDLFDSFAFATIAKWQELFDKCACATSATWQELLYGCAYATWQELFDKCACATSTTWQHRMVYSNLHLGFGTDIRSSYLVTSITLHMHGRSCLISAHAPLEPRVWSSFKAAHMPRGRSCLINALLMPRGISSCTYAQRAYATWQELFYKCACATSATWQELFDRCLARGGPIGGHLFASLDSICTCLFLSHMTSAHP